MNIEDFKKETNSKFKLYKDEYIKKLEGVLPIGSKRKSKAFESGDILNADINLQFNEFVNELFTSSD